MVRLIGFTGPARSGKDTAADTLILTQGAVRYAFADPIRSMLAVIGIDHTEIADKEAEIPAFGKSLRECMQTLGTEWGRNLVHPDTWLIVAKPCIAKLMDKGNLVVISDVRFNNEAKCIRSLGGIVVSVVRHGIEPVREHVSEAGIDRSLVDTTIFNGASIEQFRSEVAELPYR